MGVILSKNNETFDSTSYAMELGLDVSYGPRRAIEQKDKHQYRFYTVIIFLAKPTAGMVERSACVAQVLPNAYLVSYFREDPSNSVLEYVSSNRFGKGSDLHRTWHPLSHLRQTHHDCAREGPLR